MDIKIKISLTLVLVSLISMAILATFAVQTSNELLQQVSVRQLSALAEGKKRDLEKVYKSWENQLRLIRSRTLLQSSIQNYLETGDQDSLAIVNTIIATITRTVDRVYRITIFDVHGNELASSGRVAPDHVHEIPEQDIVYVDCFSDVDGGIRVTLESAIFHEGVAVGGIEIIFDGSDLIQVASNYTGLGKTGEAMLVRLQDDDTVIVLNPLRHDPDGSFREFTLVSASLDIQAVLQTVEDQFIDSVVDYRGVNVWSATRYLSQLDWGLIVKVDAREEKAIANILRDALIDIALFLSAFAIIGGTLLGFQLARPIRRLVDVVGKIRDGDMTARADTSGDDEIAYLGESLNQLMDNMESRNSSDDA